MRGLSSDIEEAVKITIQGLGYMPNIEEIGPEDMKTSMKSKVDSFKSAKSLLNKWQNSSNAPSQTKLKKHVKALIKAGDNAISVLRDGIKQEVDFSTIDVKDHGKVTTAKESIYNAIIDIDSSLIELRHQLDAEDFNLADKEFKVGYPERYANGEFFPLSNYYKDWLKGKTIKICPHGTEGEVVELMGLKVQLPKVPLQPSKILFSDLPKEEQYWRRTPLPKGLTKDNAEAFEEYIMEEFRRRREGVWFMNNGKPVYLTGTFYFTLQWCKMKDDGSYMDFRHAQNLLSYHTKAVEIDDRALGQVFFKGRRTGFTFEKIFFILDRVTSRKNWRAGITSKADADAKEAFTKLVYAFRSLPFFFKPVVRGKVDSNTALEFAKPSDSSKAAKKKGEDDLDLYLSSMIDYKATSEGSYDSTKLNDYLSDEFLKWERGRNYLSHFKQVSPTMDENGVIVGKYWAGSTMGAIGKGGEHLPYFLEESDVNKRKEISQRTGTGLYGYFLPAHKNSTLHTDIYGICHEVINGKIENCKGRKVHKGSVAYFTEKRNSAKNAGELLYGEELRNHPMKIEDLLMGTQSKNNFNKRKIYDQRRYNNSLHKSPLVRGNFKWKQGIRYSTVEFDPREDGRWVVTWMPPEQDRNKYETRGAVRFPTRHFAKLGIDPIESSVVMDKGSNAAGTTVLGRHYDALDLEESFVCHYLFRPKKVHDFFEDMLMQAIFYSSEILCENNKSGFVEWADKEGWSGFLMQDPLEKDPNKLKKGKKGFPMNDIAKREALIQIAEAYVEDKVGEITPNVFGTVYFKEILDDWEHFNPEKWTPYDSFVSSTLALLALRKPRIQTEIKYNNLSDWFGGVQKSSFRR